MLPFAFQQARADNQERDDEIVHAENHLILTAQECGGWFPEQPREPLREILDLVCGPGTWVRHVACQNPGIRLVGVDTNPRLISYARTQAREQGLSNVRFEVIDPQAPLPLPDASFDLVNCILPFTLLRKEQWPLFLQECARLLRPGGIIRLTARELPVSTSPAYEQFCSLLARALSATRYTFSPGGRSLGVLSSLPLLLVQANFQNIQKAGYLIDYGSTSERFDGWRGTLLHEVEAVAPLLLDTGTLSVKDLHTLERRLHNELSWRFCAMGQLATIRGEKPRTGFFSPSGVS